MAWIENKNKNKKKGQNNALLCAEHLHLIKK